MKRKKIIRTTVVWCARRRTQSRSYQTSRYAKRVINLQNYNMRSPKCWIVLAEEKHRPTLALSSIVIECASPAATPRSRSWAGVQPMQKYRTHMCSLALSAQMCFFNPVNLWSCTLNPTTSRGLRVTSLTARNHTKRSRT